jgi:hypothetical protein
MKQKGLIMPSLSLKLSIDPHRRASRMDLRLKGEAKARRASLGTRQRGIPESAEIAEAGNIMV